jgi:hypothetical protein
LIPTRPTIIPIFTFTTNRGHASAVTRALVVQVARGSSQARGALNFTNISAPAVRAVTAIHGANASVRALGLAVVTTIAHVALVAVAARPIGITNAAAINRVAVPVRAVHRNAAVGAGVALSRRKVTRKNLTETTKNQRA